MKFITKNALNLFSNKTIHKTFLVIGLTITMFFSFLLPFFNEPDGQYHLAVSGRISNSVIDTSKYGEMNITSGMKSQKDSYKDGTRFEKYYLNKANFISWKQAPREINYSKFNFVFWGHLIPAFGLKVGRIVYPSMGSMITFARLITSFFAIVSLTFIIKNLKKAKLIYFAVFLSPVALNSFASLSYDATGFVIVAAFVAILINILVDKELTKKRIALLLATCFLIIIACKQNYWLLLLLTPFVLMEANHQFSQKLKLRFLKVVELFKKKWWLKFLAAFMVLAFAFLITRSHGGIFVVFRRYLMTFGYNYSGANLLSNDITSWLAAPYPSENYIPTWVSAVWYLMVFAILFSEEKFIKNKYIGYLFLVFFFIGVFGVYFIMLEYNGARTSYIEGVQGRYFTPTIILLQVFAASVKTRINEYGQKLTPLFLTGLIVVSNGLLLFDTVVGLIMR
ncbi:DUF2142 domain-containing protein [Streptococcus catagoni]|uniref:DUF2142 domain-containing protein n=1 Tax=Streptococcus catagoni TaxID=2654874 RepID=UPI001409AAE9|nr:DUF2142 domain-containing protein [Streptococcus catagoni]